MPPTERDELRGQYLAAIEQEIESGHRRLADARERLAADAPDRAKATAAIADVTLDWLIAERGRLRAGGAFAEEAARRLLIELQAPD